MWYVIAFIGGFVLGGVMIFIWLSRIYEFESEWQDTEEDA